MGGLDETDDGLFGTSFAVSDTLLGRIEQIMRGWTGGSTGRVTEFDVDHRVAAPLPTPYCAARCVTAI